MLIAGHPRSMDVVYSLREMNRDDIDVFVFAWDQWGYRTTETNLQLPTFGEEIESHIKEIPGLKKYTIENNAEFIKNNDNLDIKYFNWIRYPEVFIKSQLYSIAKAYELMEEYVEETGQQYDLVIKVRFENPVVKFDFNDNLVREVNENKIIYFPDGSVHVHPIASYCLACQSIYEMGFRQTHIFEHNNPVCDMYAYGSMKSMKDYCSLFYKYDELCKEFEDHNLSMLAVLKTPHTKRGEAFILEKNERTHLETMFFYFSSYPERLLAYLLKDYMLLKSSSIIFGWAYVG